MLSLMHINIIRTCIYGEWVGYVSKCRGDTRGDFGMYEDEEDETDTDTEEEELKEISGSSSDLPERWDVLGLGQAMVISFPFFGFCFIGRKASKFRKVETLRFCLKR